MINRRGLMISTMLMSAVGVGFAGSAWAQCATEDCATLGYTEAYNSSGNCLKCPFGDMYNCEAGYICPEGYDYTCSGTGYAGGAGSACDGKYISCNCIDGYKWENGTCVENKAEFGQCNGYAANCSLGNILFSDGTCSANKVSGKTPIAVVVYKSGNCGQALALKSIGSYRWGPTNNDIPTLTNFGSQESASYDLNSCLNTEKIIAAGNKSKYPAAWAAHEYKTEGTKMGDWCLPAAGIFTSYYNNQQLVNIGLTNAGGTQFTTSTYAWSSSEYDSYFAWYSYFDGEYGLYGTNYTKGVSTEVRPVLEFQEL